jgi:hypothetical protein
MSGEPENIHADLAALADGTLPEQRREPLLALLAGSPDLAAELESQRRALVLIHSLEGVEAPALLRRSIETATVAERTPSARSANTPSAAASRRPRLRMLPRLAAAAALAAAAVVALTLALTTGGAGAPTVLEASSTGLRAATQTAPAEDPHNSRLLAVAAAGIQYPYWSGKFGWSATGARTDTIGGRTVTTVFYTDRRSRRIGYSIVSGSALAVPAGSAVVQRRGVSFQVLKRADPTIVTWREAGHTCILTAHGVDIGTLVRLAAWQRA